MSFTVCCVSGCMNEGKALHRFPDPEKFPDKFKIWKLFSGVEHNDLGGMTDIAIYNNRRICRSHFSEQFYYPRNRLCRLAVPTLLPDQQPTETKKTIVYYSASDRHSLDSHTLPKSSNALPIHDIAANKPNESLLEKNSDIQAKIPHDILKEDDPVTHKSVYVDGPPMTEDQGDISMYNDDCALRTVEGARNDSRHTPITEDQGDDSMNYDDVPLRPMAEARNDSTIEDEETDRPPGGTDECYFCNVCKESIKGFRYTCVQCEDWDLCGACEASAAHAMHYVLRIPSPRPYKEIQAVLTAVRQQLINQKILPGKADSVKEEPNSGPEDATEPDTLDWDEDFYEKDNICIELEDGEHPPRKQLHPEASSNHSHQDLNIPKSPKPTHDHISEVPFNHDVTKSSKDIQPGLIRLTGTTPQTTGTLLPTRALYNSKRTLTIKPIPRLPLGARVVKLSACFGKPAISLKKGRVHRPPRKLLHPGPLSSPSDQDLTTPKSLKPTHDRTTHVHFNEDLTNSAKDIQPGTLPNDTPIIPNTGLNRLIGTMIQPIGTPETILPTRALSNTRPPLILKPIPRLPLGSKVVKRTIIVGNSSSRLSEEKTAMNSPSMDKSSCERLEHASAVPPTTAITTLQRAAMSDPKANSNWCLRMLKGSSRVDVVKAPKPEVSVRLKPTDDSKME